MKRRKEIVLTGYRVQYIDLREPKPRTQKEAIHVMDRQWLEAIGLTGQTPSGNIRYQYESSGYKVISIETIKPKRCIELDLCQLWEAAEPPATEAQTGEEVQHNEPV